MEGVHITSLTHRESMSYVEEITIPHPMKYNFPPIYIIEESAIALSPIIITTWCVSQS